MSTGPGAGAARAEIRAIMEEKGHAVEIARRVLARLETAFERGELTRTPSLQREMDDLAVSLEQGEGQKLGGKSGEAARFIMRAISRDLDAA